MQQGGSREAACPCPCPCPFSYRGSWGGADPKDKRKHMAPSLRKRKGKGAARDLFGFIMSPRAPQTPGAGGAGVISALGEGAEVAAGGCVPAGPGPAAERSFVYSASVVELHHIQ